MRAPCRPALTGPVELDFRVVDYFTYCAGLASNFSLQTFAQK